MAETPTAGGAKEGRRFYPLKFKIEVAKKGIEVLKDEGQSFKAFARQKSLQPSQIRRWIKNLPSLKKVPVKHLRRKTMHPGGRSSLAKSKELVEWVVNLRKEGMAISLNMAVIKALQLEDSTFRAKSASARYSCVRRLLRSHSLVMRAKTHEAQRPPGEVLQDAKTFMEDIRPIVAARNKKYILNMDQTPVFFSMVPRTTLNLRGARSVNVRSSSGSTIRCTVAITVTAAGEFLKPIIVFKGTRNGRIQRETGSYRTDAYYATQERAWMDEGVMLQWVEQVLKPWAAEVPEGEIPYLLLDSYKCHLMSSVVTAIQELGIEVEHIPGGLTGLVQPVDVGINKPFKNRIRRMWEEYMLENLAVKTKPPARQTVVDWCLDSLADLGEGIIKSAWLSSHFSYFPPSENAATAAAPQEEEGEGEDSPAAEEMIAEEEWDEEDLDEWDAEEEEVGAAESVGEI